MTNSTANAVAEGGCTSPCTPGVTPQGLPDMPRGDLVPVQDEPTRRTHLRPDAHALGNAHRILNTPGWYPGQRPLPLPARPMLPYGEEVRPPGVTDTWFQVVIPHQSTDRQRCVRDAIVSRNSRSMCAWLLYQGASGHRHVSSSQWRSAHDTDQWRSRALHTLARARWCARVRLLFRRFLPRLPGFETQLIILAFLLR
jgi:hypothetical protein